MKIFCFGGEIVITYQIMSLIIMVLCPLCNMQQNRQVENKKQYKHNC